MKANNGSGNIPERDEWQTPKDLFDRLNKQYDFIFDCCSTSTNKKTLEYIDNFLEVNRLYNMSWMNPPFSKAYEMFKHFFKVVKKGVAIYRCDNMETKTWQDIIFKNASWIFIPSYRTEYKGMSNKWNRPMFASALIGYNVDPPKYLDGVVLKVIEVLEG